MNSCSAFAKACRRCSPSYLSGFSFLDWIRFLHRNHWQIQTRYLPLAAYATLRRVCTSGIKLIEDRIDLTTERNYPFIQFAGR